MRIFFYNHIASEFYKEHLVDEGLTFKEIVEKIGAPDMRYIISDAGEVLKYPECADLKPLSDTITIRGVVDGSNSGVLGAILGGLMIVAGAAISIFTAGSGIPLIAAGISMLAGSVISMVMTPNTPQLKEQEALKERYGLSRGENTPSLGSCYPIIFGTHIITPPIVGNYYTTLSDNTGQGTQYLNVLLCAGYTKLLLKNFRIGLNEFARNDGEILDGFVPITGTYAGSLEICQGRQSTLYPHKVYEDQINSELDYYDSTALVSNTRQTIKGTLKIVAIVSFQGLYGLDNNGGLVNASVPVLMRWRKIGTTNWAGSITKTFTARLNETLRYTIEHTFTTAENVDNPEGIWEVAITRGTPKTDNTRINDKAYSYALQSFTDIQPVLNSEAEKLCLVAVRIEANQATQGILNRISVIASSILPVYNGTNWQMEAVTSNPAAIYKAIIQGVYLPKKALDEQIDWDALNALYSWCETNRYYCDAVISNAEQTRTLINKVLSTCRARLYLKNGMYSLIHDIEKLNPVAILTPKNSRDFTAKKSFPERVDAINATFEDEMAEYETTSEIIFLDGREETVDTKKQEQSFFGVTSYSQVVRLSRYLLACHTHRPEAYALTVGFEHFGLPVGARVQLQHDVLLVGLANGRITAVNGRTITFDEILPSLDQTLNYGVRVFKQNGDIRYSDVVTPPPAATNTIVMTTDIEASPGDIYAFGEAGKEVIDCIIDGKTLGDDMSAELSLIPYAPEVFDAVSKPIPPYDPKVSRPQSYTFPIISPPPDDLEESILIRDDGSIYFDFGEYALRDDETSGTYIYNQGALGVVANGLYDGLSFETPAPLEHWASGGSLTCKVDNVFFQNSSIAFFIKDINLTEEKQAIFEYRSIFSGNSFSFYIEENMIKVESQGSIHSLAISDDDFICITRNVQEGVLEIYINGSLAFKFSFKEVVIPLITEITEEQIETESGSVMTTEAEVYPINGNDREEILKLFSDDAGNQFTGALRQVRVWARALDAKENKNLFENGILYKGINILGNFLGQFKEAPENPKVSDTFYYIGITNDYFINGSTYYYTISGWIREGDK